MSEAVRRVVLSAACLLVGELGFEPRQAESESAVLPLDDSPAPLSGGPERLRRCSGAIDAMQVGLLVDLLDASL